MPPPDARSRRSGPCPRRLAGVCMHASTSALGRRSGPQHASTRSKGMRRCDVPCSVLPIGRETRRGWPMWKRPSTEASAFAMHPLQMFGHTVSNPFEHARAHCLDIHRRHEGMRGRTLCSSSVASTIRHARRGAARTGERVEVTVLEAGIWAPRRQNMFRFSFVSGGLCSSTLRFHWRVMRNQRFGSLAGTPGLNMVALVPLARTHMCLSHRSFFLQHSVLCPSFGLEVKYVVRVVAYLRLCQAVGV